MLPHEARLHAGTATEDITPDGPVPMSGYGGRDGPSTGVHDRLSATALVLSDGAVTVGLLSADLLNVSRELTESVRRALSAEGVDLDELILVATHTHGGPYVSARALDVSPPLRADSDVSDYVKTLEDAFVRALTRATERLEPATIRVGHATEETVPRNRRAAGGVGGNVRVPHGPVDPTVTVLLVESESSSEIEPESEPEPESQSESESESESEPRSHAAERTVVYTFACHPVCTTGGETLLTADWPGAARRRIEAEYGADTNVLFVNGAAGDVNPRDRSQPREGDEVYEYVDAIGTQVGEAVCRALEDAASASPIERAPIRTDGREVRFPLKSTPSVETIRDRIDQLETELETLDVDGDETGYASTNWDLRYAHELLAIAEWDATSLPNRVPYVEIGDVGILGMPGEVLTQHGLDFRARASVDTLVLAGYANDYVGYVPTLAALENVGYEVRTAKIAPEAIAEFRAATFDLLAGDATGCQR